MIEQRVMSFGEHLEELRRRAFFAIAGLIVLFILGLIFGGPLLEMLAAPLIQSLKAAGQPTSLLATSPLEAFGAYIKVATVAALVVGMPWLLYQLWLFVAPGLYAYEQRFVYFLLPLSGLLTLAGCLVLYYAILPISLFFLIEFSSGLMRTEVVTAPLPPGVTLPVAPLLGADPPNESIPIGASWINTTLAQYRVKVGESEVLSVPLARGGIIAQHYRVSEYVNLVFMLALAFAIASQVPLVLLLLGWSGLVQPSDLTRYRKYVVFGCVIGSALLPTQDPWSLIVLSALMYGLFELGIVLMRVVPARRIAGKHAPTSEWATAPARPSLPAATDADSDDESPPVT